ncbi:MAG: Crp/Fnr family transcriptional regulator [Bacteroidota bacterium]
MREKMVHPIEKYLREYVSATPEEVETVINGFEPRPVAKGEWLLQQGEVCRSLYFLETGLVMFSSYQEGEQVSKFFTEPPYLFTAQQSFLYQFPAQEGIICLEDCSLWEMTSKLAMELLAQAFWANFIRKITQEVQYNTEQLYLAMQNQTAEDRYREMLSHQADLIQRVPLKFLASYLGVAPQSLSRIRKKIMTL